MRSDDNSRTQRRSLKRMIAVSLLLMAVIAISMATAKPAYTAYTMLRAMADDSSSERVVADDCEESTAWLREI